MNLSVKYEAIEELFSLQLIYSATKKEEKMIFKFKNYFLDVELFNFFLRFHRVERIYPASLKGSIFQFHQDDEITAEILGLILLYNLQKEIKLMAKINDAGLVSEILKVKAY